MKHSDITSEWLDEQIQFFEQLLSEWREKLLTVETRPLPPHYVNRRYNLLREGPLRDVGVFRYLAQNYVEVFRQPFRESVEMWLLTLKYFKEGKGVSPSYVDFILAYKATIDALAIGDETLAKQVAVEIQHRTSDKGHRLSRIFAFTLKAAVLGADEFEERLTELENEVPKRGCKQFAGHAAVLRCLLEKDAAGMTPAFESLLRGHRKLSVGAGMFNNTPDKYLCVWGVGLANLLLLRGLPVEIDDPLIPRQLLVRKEMSNEQGPISKE